MSTAATPSAQTESNPPAAARPIDQAEPLRRFCLVRAEDFTDDNTFQIAASSEYPVQRTCDKQYAALGIAREGEKFWEVLSHNEGDVDLTRFNPPNTAAFLDEHFENRHLGPITQAALSKDKVVRIVAKCDGITKLSERRAKQMRGGSRPNVSIGYKHTAYLGAESLADGRKVHRFAWAGLETSSVAVPADPTVGVFRAADKKCHCFRCGTPMDRKDLRNVDGAMICPDCDDSESQPETDESERKFQETLTRKKEAALTSRPVRKADDFRFTRDAEDEVSFGQLKNLVSVAADSDKRFKSKRENGDVFSACYVDDIVYDPDEDAWKAILYNYYDSVWFSVAFTLNSERTAVTLGEATPVQPVTSFEPVAGEASRSQVDSPGFSRSGNPAPEPKTDLTPKPMAKTIAELEAEAPQLVTEIRSAAEKQTRAAVVSESNETARKIEERNKEVRALANEAVKTHGAKWNGPAKQVFICADKIRQAEAEICARGIDHDARECRTDFKRALDEIITGARAPKNQEEAAVLPEEVASRCSLGNLFRVAMRTSDHWRGAGTFMVSEGAEAEADKEIRKQAEEFPGGPQNLPAGILLPVNMPSGVRSTTPMHRLKRDAAAGDFATAGALISPEYIWPTIELLRNLPALSRAGMTILSGVQGNLVLPRQTAAVTTSWLPEASQLTATDQAFDQVKMEPRRIGSTQNYSRLALQQTTPDFEALVMADHMAQIALGIDAGGLNGSGAADQPLGVLNQIGIGSVTFGGSAANSYKNAVAMETAVRKANIYENGSYITTSASRGMLKSVAKLLVGATTVAANPVWGDDETVQGRQAWDSQQVPGDILLYGVFRHLVMAQWGGIAVVLDTISKADKDQYKLSINTYVDFAVRHPQAFCRSSDSLAVLS